MVTYTQRKGDWYFGLKELVSESNGKQLCGAVDCNATFWPEEEAKPRVEETWSRTCLSESSSTNSLPIDDDSSDGFQSAYLAHQCSYGVQLDGISISIAQGGLQRIRREAQCAHISLKEVVNIFGSCIESLAIEGDKKIIDNKPGSHPQHRVFCGLATPAVGVSDYIWRIVRALNSHSDPAFFAADGSDLAIRSPDPSTPQHTKLLSCTNFVQTGSSIGAPGGSSRRSTPECLQIHRYEDGAMGRGLRCLLLSLVYIDRATARNPCILEINSLSVHRIILTAMYLATKFTDDILSKSHALFTRIGGVSCAELKRLEALFCSCVDFHFYVTEAEFQAHCMEKLRLAVRTARYCKGRC